MTELLTAAQMRAIEQAAIASGEVTGLELMERAGRGVVEAIFEEWPELKAGSFRAVVLCGPGNNGGDGFVVARLLKEWGCELEVFLCGDPDKLPPDARVNFERWRGMGEVVVIDDDPPGQPCQEPVTAVFAKSGDTCVFVDAMFGTGLREGAAASFWIWQDLSIWPYEDIILRVVAVDVPSGLCADSGRPLIAEEVKDRQAIIPADLTVTFHSQKPGHILAEGPKFCGKVRVADIGLRNSISADGLHLTDGWPLAYARSRLAKHTGHKYVHGHALILSGGAGRGGAARLAARGALRIGAGLVTLACPPEALAENAARLDAVMLREVHDADALSRVLEDRRINALCLGPGMGTGERAIALVAAALGLHAPGSTRGPEDEGAPEGRGPGSGPGRDADTRQTVLDADALTILAREPGLFAALHKDCVLTPHAGEFARLFPDIAERLSAPATRGPAYSKVDATREAAARAGCVVLFKGPDTVIADPSGRCSINSAHYDRAVPWLATAGSGDVLAGFIAGLLARGFAPMDAAGTAAWLHVECARTFGPGLVAEDLPEQLPAVFRGLGL